VPASPCSSSIDVSMELLERIRSGPSCDLMRRTPCRYPVQGPRTTPFTIFPTVGSNIFCRRIEPIRHRTARRLGPEAQPRILGATARQQSQPLPYAARIASLPAGSDRARSSRFSENRRHRRSIGSHRPAKRPAIVRSLGRTRSCFATAARMPMTAYLNMPVLSRYCSVNDL
jgi:hypothetical protein